MPQEEYTDLFVGSPGGGGGGNLSFQDTGLCHSNRKSTTHKSGEISQSIPINLENLLKIIPINPEMPKQILINEFLHKTIP